MGSMAGGRSGASGDALPPLDTEERLGCVVDGGAPERLVWAWEVAAEDGGNTAGVRRPSLRAARLTWMFFCTERATSIASMASRSASVCTEALRWRRS
jgi:hypothetical protein